MDDIKNKLERLSHRAKGTLPEHLGIEVTNVAPGELSAEIAIGPHHLAPNGFLHAASVIALVDSACGYGCVVSLPEGGTGFTTIELKANFLGTARDGTVVCEARLVHGGRTTQVWDAEARHEETGKLIALFRCTQMVLYPKG
jgi:uncharacterized protein (TIGR00369 family)